jgi:ABC-type transport system involved in cytochrome c biogenesis permease subunit
MIPIALIGLIIAVIPNSTPAAVKLVLIILALAWSTISCMLIMRDFVDESKKILCAYPVLLFYIFLSWYAIVS